jgi:hypothetical protein
LKWWLKWLRVIEAARRRLVKAGGSSPKADPVHTGELLATIDHPFGIDPRALAYSQVNQPRELVPYDAVTQVVRLTHSRGWHTFASPFPLEKFRKFG